MAGQAPTVGRGDFARLFPGGPISSPSASEGRGAESLTVAAGLPPEPGRHGNQTDRHYQHDASGHEHEERHALVAEYRLVPFFWDRNCARHEPGQDA